jgi:hypothetical protein
LLKLGVRPGALIAKTFQEPRADQRLECGITASSIALVPFNEIKDLIMQERKLFGRDEEFLVGISMI